MKCRKLCMSDAVTIAISQVSRKISYQLTFCQHFPSKLDLKKISSIFDFPNFTASSAKLQGSSQGYCKDGCSSGKQLIHLSSSTWQASNHHLSPCSGTMTSLSLFLCIAGWYTVCSCFIYLLIRLVLYLFMYFFAWVFNVCTHTCTRGITWKMNMHMCLSIPWHFTCYRRAISILKSQPAFISYNVLTL